MEGDQTPPNGEQTCDSTLRRSGKAAYQAPDEVVSHRVAGSSHPPSRPPPWGYENWRARKRRRRFLVARR